MSPEEGHQAFSTTANHLEEVRANHQKVLHSAGLVAEGHLSDIAPERVIEWLAGELNGEADEKGIRLPLMGLGPEDVDVSISTVKGIPTLKLKLGEHIERSCALPEGVADVNTAWDDGYLEISYRSNLSE